MPSLELGVIGNETVAALIDEKPVSTGCASHVLMASLFLTLCSAGVAISRSNSKVM